jgi:predicted acylesterase/phospholipase RssA
MLLFLTLAGILLTGIPIITRIKLSLIHPKFFNPNQFKQDINTLLKSSSNIPPWLTSQVPFSKLLSYSLQQDSLEFFSPLAKLWMKSGVTLSELKGLNLKEEEWIKVHSMAVKATLPPEKMAIFESMRIREYREISEESVAVPFYFLLKHLSFCKRAPLLCVIKALFECKNVKTNSFLLAAALPQPAFFGFAFLKDEVKGLLDRTEFLARKEVDVALMIPKEITTASFDELLRHLWERTEGSIALPGLCMVASKDALRNLPVDNVYALHGELVGSLILSVIAERRSIAGVVPVLPNVLSGESLVQILQRKILALAPPEIPMGSSGWLSMFGDWLSFGSSSSAAGQQKEGSTTSGLRVLALDGGGTRSLISTIILQRILGENASIADHFDLIIGTSAGGLLAIALGCLKLPLKEAESIVKDLGTFVFSKGSQASSWESVRDFYWHGERHSSNDLEKYLSHLFGQLTLLELSAYKNSKCKVAVVATKASTKPASVYLFRNYELPKKSQSRYSGDSKTASFLAARATTAAPTFFQPLHAKSDIFQDGALFANNPAHIALHEAVKLFSGKEISVLLSVGTGRTPWGSEESSNSPGIQKASLLHSITRDLSTLVYSATSTEATADILADMLSPSKYFRFQPELGRLIEIDECRPDVLQEMISKTEEYLDTPLIKARIDQLKNILKPTKKKTGISIYSKL